MRIFRFHRPTIDNADLSALLLAIKLDQQRANGAMHLSHIFGRSRFACANRPDRFISDGQSFSGIIDIGQGRFELLSDKVSCLTPFAHFLRFTAAHNNAQTRFKRSLSF